MAPTRSKVYPERTGGVSRKNERNVTNPIWAVSKIGHGLKNQPGVFCLNEESKIGHTEPSTCVWKDARPSRELNFEPSKIRAGRKIASVTGIVSPILGSPEGVDVTNSNTRFNSRAFPEEDDDVDF